MSERRSRKRTIRHVVPPNGTTAAPVVDDQNTMAETRSINENSLMTEEETRFLMQMLRAAPDGLLMHIVQTMPVETLIQLINEVPIQGRLQVLPQRLNKLISLQEKLVHSLNSSEQNKE